MDQRAFRLVKLDHAIILPIYYKVIYNCKIPFAAITFGLTSMKGGPWSPYRGSPKFPQGASPQASPAGPAAQSGRPSVARNLFGSSDASNNNNTKPRE